jgi:hypothetical protein
LKNTRHNGVAIDLISAIGDSVSNQDRAPLAIGQSGCGQQRRL